MTASVDEQTLDKALDDYIEKVNATVGEVKAVPVHRTQHREYTLAFRDVTADLIRMFTVANGDTNPLWRNPSYAHESPWGGIIAPPLYTYTAAATTAYPEPPEIEGIDLMHGGNKVLMHRAVRPGDSISAVDVWNGVENKSKPGRPQKLLIFNGERQFSNQHGQLVATLQSRMVAVVKLPGAPADQPAAQRPAPSYTDAQLQQIYDHYNQELDGELRRGGEPRFWEDVHAGDELGQVIKGPLDALDVATFIGALGVGIANADKWEMTRTELSRSPKDPQTGAYHYNMDWHLVDSSAQSVGMPRAINFGAYIDINASHLINNWLGDHGWVREFESRFIATMFSGDTLRLTGTVTRAFEEDGRGFAELAIRGVEQNGVDVVNVRAIVQLPHRGSPNEVVEEILSGV